MEKFLKYLMLMLVATFSLTFTACGGDDDDEPGKPNVTTSDILSGDVSEGISVQVIENDTYSPCFYWKSNILGCSFNPYGEYKNVSMAQIGRVSKLSDIKTAPTAGWNINLSLEDNNGYVLTYTYRGKPYYVRLLITLNKSVSGETVGIHYQFQHFTPSNQ